MSEEILINVTPQGEVEKSRMHLTCIRAAERPAMGEVVMSRTFSERSCRRTGWPWTASPGLASGAGGEARPGRAGDQLYPNATPGMAGKTCSI